MRFLLALALLLAPVASFVPVAHAQEATEDQQQKSRNYHDPGA